MAEEMEAATGGREETSAGTESAAGAAGAAGGERMAAGQEEEANGEREEEKEKEKEEEKEKEKEWMLDHLTWYRDEWTAMWSDYYGDLEKRTEVPPMQFNQEPVPSYAHLCSALQIFSVKVIELEGTMSWPIDVFGLIAVRDSVDHNRNYIFERNRDNCQTLTAKDSSLILTGPSRAVLLIDPVEFEVELRAKGKTPSEDKLLSAEVFGYNCIGLMGSTGFLQTCLSSSLRCTLEFKYAHLDLALEAAVKVWISEGSTDFCGKFVVRTSSINENVTLLDSGDRTVSVSDDGVVNFSRSVVVVEGNDAREKLIVGVEARQNGDDDDETSRVVCKEVTFVPAKSGESYGTVDVGFCKMSVVVSWSLVF